MDYFSLFVIFLLATNAAIVVGLVVGVIVCTLWVAGDLLD